MGLSSAVCLSGPLRGHARSHRYCIHSWSCGLPVGAGVPAKGPTPVFDLLPTITRGHAAGNADRVFSP
ncbi:hypothetical protein C1X72_21615 [Pseudomonas sp. FW306-2-2C-D06B]|nr:hypothetical protein C1X72_21615 [Pseudomonas sp. FW306-2-2C-D06B]